MRPKTITETMTTAYERRNGFEHRICNDLCELILCYLATEDKVRLECVSKQFKRSVYQRQYRFDCYLLTKHLKRFTLKEIRSNLNTNYWFVWSPVARFLSKCQNLISVNVPYLALSGEYYDRLLNIVIDNCTNLRQLTMLASAKNRQELQFHSKNITISSGTIKKFIEKFMDQIEIIETNGIIEKSGSYHLLKNLKCFYLSNQLLKPTNLTKLVYFYQSKNNIIFEAILQSNRSSLKTLHLVNRRGNELNLWAPISQSDNITLEPILASVSQLKNLVHLNIEFSTKQKFDDSIRNQIKDIGRYCKRLKSLIISVYGITGVKAFNNLFDVIDCFKSLKRFKLIADRFSCDLLLVFSQNRPVLSQLTHLHIGCNPSDNYVYDSFYNDIEKVLPNLQYLHLSNVRLNDSMLRSLSKLTRLVDLVMTPSNAYYDWPQLFVLSDIFNNCTKLQSFSIYYFTFDSQLIGRLRGAQDKVNFEEIMLNICPKIKNFFWLIEGDDRMFHLN